MATWLPVDKKQLNVQGGSDMECMRDTERQKETDRQSQKERERENCRILPLKSSNLHETVIGTNIGRVS